MREKIIEMSSINIGSLSSFLNNKKNIKYLELVKSSVPNEIENISEMVYYFVNDIKDLLLCDCGKQRKFIGFKNGHRSTCGDKGCFIKKRKETCLDKYGVDNPKKSKDILENEKKNILERWGGKHYMFSTEVRDKFNSTMLSSYGVEWAQQSKEISEKSKKTFNQNPNKESIINNRFLKIKSKSFEEKVLIANKRKTTISDKWGSLENYYNYFNSEVNKTSFEKYGVKHHFLNEDISRKKVESYKNTIKNKIISILPSNIEYVDRLMNDNKTDLVIKLKCECGNIFDINRQYLYKRISINENPCLVCNPTLSGKSNKELDILNFIIDNYNGEILNNTKNIISNELDIYLPK